MYLIFIYNICNPTQVHHLQHSIFSWVFYVPTTWNQQWHRVLVVFVLLSQKSSISMKVSRYFISWHLSVLDVLSSSNRNESSTLPKARISFIVILLDLAMSICRCTNSNSFFIALMLAFPVFGCCCRALNFGRFALYH